MAGVMTFDELARAARTAGAGAGAANPLTVVVPAAGPLSPQVAREVALVLLGDVKRRFATGTDPDGRRWRPLKYPRPSGGGVPLRDTGRLMASFTTRTTSTEVAVGTKHPGASLHQFGGIIRPRRRKFLAIPLTREARRAGSPLRMKGKGNKKVPLFARKVGGKWVGHFLLVRKAVVPPRPFLGISPQALATVGRVIAEAAARTWREAK